jgi:hypothetical protein
MRVGEWYARSSLIRRPTRRGRSARDAHIAAQRRAEEIAVHVDQAAVLADLRLECSAGILERWRIALTSAVGARSREQVARARSLASRIASAKSLRGTHQRTQQPIGATRREANTTQARLTTVTRCGALSDRPSPRRSRRSHIAGSFVAETRDNATTLTIAVLPMTLGMRVSRVRWSSIAAAPSSFLSRSPVSRAVPIGPRFTHHQRKRPPRVTGAAAKSVLARDLWREVRGHRPQEGS